MAATGSYYRTDLALVHHRGFGSHADACAPGILDLLADIRARDGLVVELGCGSGLLTRHLVDAGHRVVATDASEAMLAIARDLVPDALEVRRLVLPADPIPAADAIVSVGHVLNYLPDRESVDRALMAIAASLRPGGLVAIDLCDLEYGRQRRDAADLVAVEDDWAIITRFSLPSADRFVRRMTVFAQRDDGTWHRDDEQHDNVLLDVSTVPRLLGGQGVEAEVRASFGAEQLPQGLLAVVGRRR